MNYPDAHRASIKPTCKYILGEDYSERHARRLSENLSSIGNFSKWASSNGFNLCIMNDGHHWKIEGKGLLAEWWPSSAKLVINKKWAWGIHCHDVGQLIAEIEKVLRDMAAIGQQWCRRKEK